MSGPTPENVTTKRHRNRRARPGAGPGTERLWPNVGALPDSPRPGWPTCQPFAQAPRVPRWPSVGEWPILPRRQRATPVPQSARWVDANAESSKPNPRASLAGDAVRAPPIRSELRADPDGRDQKVGAEDTWLSVRSILRGTRFALLGGFRGFAFYRWKGPNLVFRRRFFAAFWLGFG